LTDHLNTVTFKCFGKSPVAATDSSLFPPKVNHSNDSSPKKAPGLNNSFVK